MQCFLVLPLELLVFLTQSAVLEFNTAGLPLCVLKSLLEFLDFRLHFVHLLLAVLLHLLLELLPLLERLPD